MAIAVRAARDGANIVLLAKTTEPNPKLPGTLFSAAEAVEAAGGQALPVSVRLTGAPVNTVPPFNTLNFIIAVQGIYPSRP